MKSLESLESSQRPITIYSAIISDFGIAIAKFLAASITGSSAMISEGIHSLADTGNQGLMLLGRGLSRKPADETHPYGYGMEVYFWSLIVAVILFGLGGGLSIYEGISHLRNPPPLEDPTWNYVVLGIAFILEGTSLAIATRKQLQDQKKDESFLHSVHMSKNPEVFFEDTAALAGVLIAFLGVFLSHQFHNIIFDSAASILIGAVLAVIAIFLAYETRLLLLGEGADEEDLRRISDIIRQDEIVVDVKRPLTMYFGPKDVLLNIDINFKRGATVEEVANAVDRIEKSIRAEFPEIHKIFIEAKSIKSGQEIESDSQSKNA
jgi:cation diffusion facilitator family transporter